MNEMASNGEPFFFMADAWAQRWVVIETARASDLGIQWALSGAGNAPEVRPILRKFSFRFLPVSLERYAQGFRVIREAQLRGETWLANLTFPAKLETDLTLKEFFNGASAEFRLHFPKRLTVFSPERFVRIYPEGRISAHPMKGTINASIPDAAKKILENPKEAAEHVTIVDLIRNDLGMIADRVEVPRYRFITKVTSGESGLLQVSSEIAGDLGPEWRSRVGTILARLLPAGSVTGAPKKRTGEIILKAEQHERGWYTGVFGCFDGRQLDSAVAIRFIRQDAAGNLIYHSGGGITIDSDMEQEYAELKEKIYVPFA